jgi:hypothetical protein
MALPGGHEELADRLARQAQCAVARRLGDQIVEDDVEA